MFKLYSKCLEEENIIHAIREVQSHDSSRTSGPDGTNFKKDKRKLCEVIKQVKLRLKRRKRVCSRVIEIPKVNGMLQRLTVTNLDDRYAQQAVYRVINPIVELKLSAHSYGFREGISAKVPVSRVCDIILHAKRVYTVEIDFKECFDNIFLDHAISALREFGINDAELLKTVKHLMYVNKRYSGVGLNYGTILGTLLCNCYLGKLDRFMEEEFQLTRDGKTESRQRDYRKHKDRWLEWLQERQRKVYCSYYRYINSLVILTTIKPEQRYIQQKVMNFIMNETSINANLSDCKMRINKVDFLGFHIMKSNSVWIKVKNEDEIVANVKKYPLMDHEGVRKFKRFVIGVLNYYDIVNDMGSLLKKLYDYLYFQSRKRHGYLVMNSDRTFSTRKGHDSVDIWSMRKETRNTYKMYIINSAWIAERERLIDFSENDNEWYMYKLILFTRQKGKDIITGENLKAKRVHIHHVIPRKLGGSDELNNLVLLNEETHVKLHSNCTVPKEFEKYRKHLQA